MGQELVSCEATRLQDQPADLEMHVGCQLIRRVTVRNVT